MVANVNLDLDFVRAQFPAFIHPRTRDWAFLENAGGSYMPQTVIDRLQRFLVETRVQPYGPYEHSIAGGTEIDEAHACMAEMINAEDDEVTIGASTTLNVYVLAQAIRPWFAEGDEIVVTNQDHEANGGAWRRFGETGVTVREWRIDPTSGELDPAALEPLLSPRTRLVCFPHCSNIVGTLNDAAAITRRVHDAGALVMIDGVSYAPHQCIDVKALDADFYGFSLYKTYGPHLGVLYTKRAHLEKLAHQSHEQIADDLRQRLDPAGVIHEQVACLSGITDYYDAVYAHHFAEGEADRHTRIERVFDLFAAQEEILTKRLLGYLGARAGVRVIGDTTGERARRAPTISFTAKDRSSKEVAIALAEHQIAVRAGSFYAWRCVEALGIDAKDGVVRVSMVHYNTVDEVDRLIAALEAVL